MEEQAGRGTYRIVALRKARDATGRSTDVRFTYRGRDFRAEREPGRREWRVCAGVRVVGFVGAPDGADPNEVAEAVVTLYGRGVAP